MNLIDTHCHLNFDTFAMDCSDVLDRAWDAGLSKILIPGADIETSRIAISRSAMDPRLYAAVGVHPNDAISWNDQTLLDIETLALQPKVSAIGEIGLDHYRDYAPWDLQEKIFRSQLDLAARLHLPVIIHSRSAEIQVMDILRDWVRSIPESSPLQGRFGVLHSYDGSLELAQEAVELGFWIGLSGPLTYKNASTRREMAVKLPLERLLLETDAPYLTPIPFRGHRNEPAYVRYVAQTLADTRQIPLETAAEVTTAGAARLFGWSLS